ncbi:MAG TPA: hypothetical protein VFC65_14220 [Prolixibacteraceae bacterium]|nr:hypothetical protein [Prolixibacteraceae bacterium]
MRITSTMTHWIILLLFTLAAQHTNAAVYQWSVPVTSVISPETNDHPRAFLWIPENCKQVRAVLIGQHNMTEELIFEHPKFREEMSELGIAEVWITPGFNMVFDFNKSVGEQFESIMNALAEESGYSELKFAPAIPIGHSACASYPWNFAAWNPDRTFAILSIHGDAPLTNLTGSGRPNPDWGDRNINGVPGLMVEGEYEWWEDRVQPALNFQQKFPKAAISFLCDAGHGHFDISDELIDYLNLFIRKAVQYRLPKESPLNKPVKLIPVNPENGWLKERWKQDQKPQFPSAPFAQYKGDRKDAFWYFDQETAEATEKYYAQVRGKKEQYPGFSQNGKLLTFNPKLHARIVGKFEPEADGLIFHVKAEFTDTLRAERSTDHGKGNLSVSRICGPVEKLNDTTFTVRFYRMGLNNEKRTGDIWLMASHSGDENYKSTVQQFNIRIPFRNTEGMDQQIKFDHMKDVKSSKKSIDLKATSDSRMLVYFYVQEGPAKIVDGKLVFTKIPPRAKFPVKVTVVAWQYGRSVEPKVKTAEPVAQSFYLTK